MEALEGLAVAAARGAVKVDASCYVTAAIEATAIIRQLPHYSVDEVAIIALTADLQIQQQTDLEQHGFNNFMSKPISRGTLLDSIQALEKVLAEPVTEEIMVQQSTKEPIDLEAALSAAGGNRDWVHLAQRETCKTL